MRVLLLALFLLFLAISTAEALQVQPPPKRYDHAFNGKINITHRPHWWIISTMFAHAYTYIPLPGEKVCQMTMPYLNSYITREVWYKLYYHERGHCNGWPPNHPK